MSRGRLINVVAFCSWPEKEGTKWTGNIVEQRTQEELLEHFEGWEEEVVQLLTVSIFKPSPPFDSDAL